MDGIVSVAKGSAPVALGQEADAARSYAAASRAASTRLIYDADWRRFQTWCAVRACRRFPPIRWRWRGFVPARSKPDARRPPSPAGWPPSAGRKPPQHADGGEAIAEVMAGIRRSRAAPPAQKVAADADVLRACSGEKLRAVRARAVLAIGFAGAFRRSELVAIRVEDLRRDAEGIRVVIRRSKADHSQRINVNADWHYSDRLSRETHRSSRAGRHTCPLAACPACHRHNAGWPPRR